MSDQFDSEQKVDSQTVSSWFNSKKACFSEARQRQVIAGLKTLSIKKWQELQTISFVHPMLAIVVSVFFGCFGLDRFLIGDSRKGLLKLVTFGGFFIWAIVDWFLIHKDTIKSNELKFFSFLIEPLWIRNIRKKDPELADLWQDWDTHFDSLLLRAKQNYEDAGMHDKAMDVDTFIDRYKNV